MYITWISNFFLWLRPPDPNPECRPFEQPPSSPHTPPLTPRPPLSTHSSTHCHIHIHIYPFGVGGAKDDRTRAERSVFMIKQQLILYTLWQNYLSIPNEMEYGPFNIPLSQSKRWSVRQPVWWVDGRAPVYAGVCVCVCSGYIFAPMDRPQWWWLQPVVATLYWTIRGATSSSKE